MNNVRDYFREMQIAANLAKAATQVEAKTVRGGIQVKVDGKWSATMNYDAAIAHPSFSKFPDRVRKIAIKWTYGE